MQKFDDVDTLEKAYLINGEAADYSSTSSASDPTDDKFRDDCYPSIIVVTTAVFMGYASLVAWQKKLKDEMGINDNDAEQSQIFQTGVSLVYLGNLIFRLLHNFVFFFLIPRHRVYVSILCMCCSMFILGFMIFFFHIHRMELVYAAYGLGGISIGSFESNVLSAVTPLGHRTKQWAIIGFPLGFAIVLVGGYFIQGLGVEVWLCYAIVIGCIAISLILYSMIPAISIKNNSTTLPIFISQLKGFRNWMPKIWKHCLALMFDMFFLSLFSGIMLYIYDGDNVPLLGTTSAVLVKNSYFFAFHNSFTCIGDITARKIAYHWRFKSPFVYLVCSLAGAALCFSTYAILAPIGIFMIFFANGSIYASSTKRIDSEILPEYNLITLSFWLFVGDVGSFIGSFLLQQLKIIYCTDLLHPVAPYFCVQK